ncbi:MAG: hypothetical protein ACLRM8_01630 [Alistipes sp.]
MDGLRLVAQFSNHNRHSRSHFFVKNNPTTGTNIRPTKEAFTETNRMDFQTYLNWKKTFAKTTTSTWWPVTTTCGQDSTASTRVQGGIGQDSDAERRDLNITNYPTSTRTDSADLLLSDVSTTDFREKYLLSFTDARRRLVEIRRATAGVTSRRRPAGSDEEAFWPPEQGGQLAQTRPAYGLTGNNGIGLYDTYGSYNSAYQYNGMSTTTTGEMPNNNLTWESTTQVNAGLDMGLADDRSAREFRLLRQSDAQPAVRRDAAQHHRLRFGGLQRGAGRFYGVDLAISSVSISRGDFTWIPTTYSFNMNRVLELPDNGNPRNRINGISVGDGSQFGGIAEGERMGRIFGYVAERIIETQEEADAARYDTQSRGYRRSDRRQIAGRKDIGDYEWKDRPGSTRMDGRQIINAEDQFLLGYALPHSTGGIGNTFRTGTGR